MLAVAGGGCTWTCGTATSAGPWRRAGDRGRRDYLKRQRGAAPPLPGMARGPHPAPRGRFLLIGADRSCSPRGSDSRRARPGCASPGTLTGSVSLSLAETVRTELTRPWCGGEGQVDEALALYGEVLAVAPNHPRPSPTGAGSLGLTRVLAAHDTRPQLARPRLAGRGADRRPAVRPRRVAADGGTPRPWRLSESRAFIADGRPQAAEALGPEAAFSVVGTPSPAAAPTLSPDRPDADAGTRDEAPVRLWPVRSTPPSPLAGKTHTEPPAEPPCA